MAENGQQLRSHSLAGSSSVSRSMCGRVASSAARMESAVKSPAGVGGSAFAVAGDAVLRQFDEEIVLHGGGAVRTVKGAGAHRKMEVA